VVAAEAAGETARQRLPALEQSVQESTAQRDEAKQDLDDTIKYRRMLEENEKQLANVRSGVELKLKGRKAALDDADAAEQCLGRELDAARQRLSVLRELEKNMDGYQNSVKAVMRAAGARRLRGIIGPVSAILKVEPGCEVAVETALGGALQNIVVENEAAAKAAIALLLGLLAGRFAATASTGFAGNLRDAMDENIQQFPHCLLVRLLGLVVSLLHLLRTPLLQR